MSKGSFIVFEGIDGSGTTTQCHLLAQKIKKLGHPVTETREPGGTPLAESIRALVLDPNSVGITDLTELLLYAASRVQHVNEKIRPSLQQGAHVICDRYTGSTWAYQGYGRGLDPVLLAQVTTIAADGCEPDLTIYLRVSPQIAADRRGKRGQRPDRLELAGDDFQVRVADGYQKLAERDLLEGRGVVVDGNQSQDQVASEIWNALQKRWPQFPLVHRHGAPVVSQGSQ